MTSLSVSYTAHAQGSSDFELVVNIPTETTLQHPALQDAQTTWQQLFDGATSEIEIAQFYVSSLPDTALDAVLQSLKRAGQRGVKIRFLLDQKGLSLSNPDTIQYIQHIPNLEWKVMDFSKIDNGIIHAKYLIVDGRVAFVGSQNFDWRALKHIHETGLKIQDAQVVGQMKQIFQTDWNNQTRLGKQQSIPHVTQHKTPPQVMQGDYLLASPPEVTPANIYTVVDNFPKLIASAQSNINIQVMQYSPLSYAEGKGKRVFYDFIERSLREAAARGVKINLMIADWNIRYPDILWIKSLALVPNINIKIVTIPKSKDGFIPYARVIHSKYMTIDHKTAWVGTSNWSGGYFEQSRNLEIVLNNNADITQNLDRLYDDLWQSEYAHAVDVNMPYKVVNPAKE
ncbi:phospholipase D-like domain-containing protein [Acinetobacter rathckeae]|uniref:phospholipase D-like domain-containing protein n=1 Tax=Acinetobacter rathckeae TaxID=2605272 RepID=UPI001BB41BF1|nr:phospholipase D-like domain-containing protein [Acinetobacter rathckeae]